MTPICVALDGTPLTVATGGVRRYVEQLTDALRRGFPDDQYHVISDQLERPASWLERRWWFWGIRNEMERRGAHLFHGTDFSVPYFPAAPSVVTIHDLSPWRTETRLAASSRIRRRTPLLLRLGWATMVITPTEAIRREAIDAFGLPPGTTVAVPLAASDIFRPVVNDFPVRPYFLYVGTIEERKNVGLIVRCWRQVRRTLDVDLVIAGRVRDPIDLEGATVLGAVPDEQLPGLYAGAVATLYPSSYEGFGLPVLEAMQCGSMVITSRDPAIREVAGEGALQLEIGHEAAWVEAMISAMAQPVRALWRERGLRRAAEFSWDQTARRTREVYVEALRRR